MLFHLPLGVDFAAALHDGIIKRHGALAPHDFARILVIVNSARLHALLRDCFDQGQARLLPRIRLLGEMVHPIGATPLPASMIPLINRLEALALIKELLEREPGLAPRLSPFDLSDSLVQLFEEMEEEEVSAETLADIDVGAQSAHWQRSLKFLDIAAGWFAAAGRPGERLLQGRAIDSLAREWRRQPPDHPVIIAGTTGSRGSTQKLMLEVARLAHGAVVLPGFDTDLPPAIWKELASDHGCADHPQHRLAQVIAKAGIDPGDLQPWVDARPPNPQRNALISLSLRPAPTTDQWRSDGPALGDPGKALESVTLLEAADARQEALAIAIRLREAAEARMAVMVVASDNDLVRRIMAACGRWGLEPDDSSGVPLHLSLVGRLLLQLTEMAQAGPSIAALLAILKHPLASAGSGRRQHLNMTRRLELFLRRREFALPTEDALKEFADRALTRSVERIKDASGETDQAGIVQGWTGWVGLIAMPLPEGETSLARMLEWLVARAELVASGPGWGKSSAQGSDVLWQGDDGKRVAQALAEAASAAGAACGVPRSALGLPETTVNDFGVLITRLLAGRRTRPTHAAHPQIMIRGTREARLQSAPLIILAGLNEGSWPQPLPPDPWLNRQMRARAGLRLPERLTGLSAHDFQQAVAAPEVWLTRSRRFGDTDSVPSRWLNRLTSLISGLHGQGGADALEAMRQRGARYLCLARRVENSTPVPRALRPSPCPPARARLAQLPVTAMKTLRRDPYAIYARYILRLLPIPPLVPVASARLRGLAVHEALEGFIASSAEKCSLLTVDAFLDHMRRAFDSHVPWSCERELWMAHMAKIAPGFIGEEIRRRQRGKPGYFEIEGQIDLGELPFVLKGRIDRVDIDENGTALLYDYKTGVPPGIGEQRDFDRQLLLLAAMVERGAFGGLGRRQVTGASYIGLGMRPKVVNAIFGQVSAGDAWDDLVELVRKTLAPDHGFTSHRAEKAPKGGVMEHRRSSAGDYDHLARLGEWDTSDVAKIVGLK